MSKSIDNKVVSMEFDNSKFEKPAQESISTLDKLKEALHFKNVESGFDAMNHAIKKVTFDPLMKGVDTVYAKFTFFERFTIQLYDRLANKIIDTGKLIAKETFTTPISSGKSEYEEKMTSVQTIMASTGESLETVNKYLNELNKYSDDTIYLFRDMTTNIGKFTNAGVKLEDAVAAIKGVSNEAARSGANANEASRAMYNFAQALSTGSVKLIDWKSIENANMATVEFKNELLKTAAAIGTVTKTSEGMYKTMKGHAVSATQGFNDNLSDAWLTSEVLIKTLKKYSDETTEIGKASTAAATEVKTFTMMMDTLKESLQSGWAESWEYMFGDFEKAKQLWTDLSKVLGGLLDRMSRTRNTMLKFWNEFGGRTAMLNAIKNAWKALTTVLGAVRDAFRTVFPPMTGQKLVELTERFEHFTKSLKPSYVTIQRLRSTFTGLFSAVGIVIDAFKALYNVLRPLVGKAFSFITGELLEGSASLGEWVTGLRESIKEGRVFERVFGKVGEALAWVGSKLKSAFLAIKDITVAFKNGGISAGFDAIRKAIGDLFQFIWDFITKHNPITFIKDLGVKIGEAIYEWPVGKAIVDFVKKVKDTIVNSSVWKFCEKVVNGFVDAIQAAINRFRGIDTSAEKEFTDNVKEGFHPLEAIKNFFVKIWHGIQAVWEVIGPAIKTVGKFIGNAFSGLFSTLKGILDRSDVGDIGTALMGGGIGYLVFNLGSLIKNIKGMTVDIGKVAKSFAKFFNEIIKTLRAVQTGIKAHAFKELATGVLMLAGALFILSGLPEDKMYKSAAALVFLIGAVTKTLATISNKSIGEGGGGKAAALVGMGAQLLMVAGAITVLIADLAILSLLPYNNLIKGMAMLLFLLRAISKEALNFAGKDIISPKVLAVFAGLGAAITAMTLSLAVITGLVALSPAATLTAAGIIVAMVSILGLIVKTLSETTTKYEKNGKKITKSAASFVSMVAPIVLIVYGIKMMTLAVTAVAVEIMAIGLENVGTALGIIVGVAAVVVGSALAIEKIMWRYLKGTRKDIALKMGVFALTMGAVTTAILAIAGGLLLLGLLPIEKMKLAMQAMAVIISLIGLIAVLLILVKSKLNGIKPPSKGVTEKLGNGIRTLRDIAILMAAMAIAVIGVAGAAVLIAKADTNALNKAMGVFLAIAAMIGVIAYFSKGGGGVAGATILSTIRYLGMVAAAFAVAVALLAIAFKTLSTMSEDEVKKTIKNLNMLADDLNNNSFKYGTAVGVFIGNIIAAIVSSLGSSVKQLATGLIDMINGVLDVIIEKGPVFFDKLWDAVIMLCDSIIKRADEVTEKLVTALVSIIGGLANAISNHRSEIVEAVNKLFEEVIRVVVELFARLMGVSKEKLSEISEYVLPWAKRIGLALIGIFAYKKLKSAADKAFSVFDTIKKIGPWFTRQLNNFKSGIWYIKEATKEAGSLSSAIKGGYFELGKTSTIFSKVYKGITSAFDKIKGLAASHPLLTAVVLIGTALAAVFKIGEKFLDVIEEDDKLATESANRMRQAEEEYQELLKKRQDAYKVAQNEYEIGERYLERLRDCVDAQGKLVKGKEDEFLFLQKRLEPYMKIILDETTKRVTAEDEYGRSLDVTSQKLDEVYKKMMLQKQIEAAMSTSEEAYTKVNSGELDEAINDAYDRWISTKNEKITLIHGGLFGEDLKVAREDLAKIGDISSYIDDIEKKYNGSLDSAQRNKVKQLILSAQGALILAREEYESTLENKQRYQAVADNWEMLAEAAGGSTEQMQAALDKVNANVLTKKVGAGLNQLKIEVLNTRSDLIKAVNAGNLTDAVKRKAKAAFEQLIPDIKSYGEEAWNAFKDELGFKSDDIDAIIEQLTAKVASSKNAFSTVELGVALLDGLAKGIISEEEFVIATLNRVADKDIIANIKKKLGIESPSKVFADIGKYTILGLINGVTSKENALEKTYSAMAAGNIAAYTAAMSAGGSSMVFTPMINQAGIQNGTAAIQGQLNSLTATPLGATLTSQLAARVDTSQIDADHSNVLNAMNGIRDEILNLSDRLANLEVVMDTGATVGALAPAMDMELGRRTVRKARGV